MSKGRYQAEPVSFGRHGLAFALLFGAFLWVPLLPLVGLLITYFSRSVAGESRAFLACWLAALALNVAGVIWTLSTFITQPGSLY